MICFFHAISMSRRKFGPCHKCGKRRQRTKVFEHTVNPFNRRADGTPKSEAEVREDVRAEADAWMALPLVCAACELKPAGGKE